MNVTIHNYRSIAFMEFQSTMEKPESGRRLSSLMAMNFRSNGAYKVYSSSAYMELLDLQMQSPEPASMPLIEKSRQLA